MAMGGNSKLAFDLTLIAALNKTSMQETQKQLLDLGRKNKISLGFDQKMLDKQVKFVAAAQDKLAKSGLAANHNLFAQMDKQYQEKLKQFEGMMGSRSGLTKTHNASVTSRDQVAAQIKTRTDAGLSSAGLVKVLEGLNKVVAKTGAELQGNLQEITMLNAQSNKIEHEILAKSKIIADIEKKQKTEGLLSNQLTQGKALGQGVLGVFSHAKSGDVKGFTEAIGGGLAKIMENRAQKAKEGAKLAEASGLPGAASQMASAEAMGMAATAMAGLAVGLGAFIALLSAADSQAKDFNKSLLEGAGAGDFAFNNATASGADMLDTLDAARGASINMVDEFRGEAKEYTAILNQLDQAGMTYKRMIDGAKDASEKQAMLAENIRSVVTWSKVLGLSTAEVATKEAELQQDYGIGQDAIKERFMAISEAASHSGMSTKNFFTSVSQATSGMSLYNVRMEEAAELLLTTSKILGGTDASEFIKSLTKDQAGKSYTDRFKEIMVHGEGATGGFEGSMKSAVQTFADEMKSNPGVAEAIQTAMGDLTLKAEDTEGLTKAFSNATEKQQRDLRAALYSSDSPNVQASLKTVESVQILAAAQKGGLKEQARALSQLNMTSQLTNKWTIGNIPQLNKRFSEMTKEQLAGFESVSGVTGEGLENMMRVQEVLNDMYQKSLKEGEKDGGLAGLNEFVRKDAEAQEFAKKAENEMLTNAEKWAQTTATNTQSIADILKNDVVWTLNKIYTILESVIGFVEPESEREKGIKLKDNAKEVAQLSADLAKMTAAGDPAEAIAIKQQELDAAQTNRDAIVASTDSWTNVASLIAGNTSATTSLGMHGDMNTDVFGMLGRLTGASTLFGGAGEGEGTHRGPGTTTTGEEIGHLLSPNQKEELKKYMAGEKNNWNTVGRKAIADGLGDHDIAVKLEATAAKTAPAAPVVIPSTTRPAASATVVSATTGSTTATSTGATVVTNNININGGSQAEVYKTVTAAVTASKTR